MRTEYDYFVEHTDTLLSVLDKRINEIESKPDLDDQDEIELSAIDLIYRDLMDRRGY